MLLIRGYFRICGQLVGAIRIKSGVVKRLDLCLCKHDFQATETQPQHLKLDLITPVLSAN